MNFINSWVQSKITKAADYLDTAADYMKKDKKQVKEGSLHKWFKGSKSKDGKGGWVNVVTGGTCASDEPVREHLNVFLLQREQV